MVHHGFSGSRGPQNNERAHEVTQGIFALATIGHPGMGGSLARHLQKIPVMGDQHALLLRGKSQLVLIGGGEQLLFRARGHIHAVLTQGKRQGGIDILIEVEAWAVRHGTIVGASAPCQGVAA